MVTKLDMKGEHVCGLMLGSKLLVVGMEWAVGVGNADVGDVVVNGNVGQVDDLYD